MFKTSFEIFKVVNDIVRGVNTTIWGSVEEANKVGKLIKTGLSGADVVIETSHALEDLSCNNYVCATLDIVSSISSAVGLVLGNIPSTKSLTTITGSVTVGCRSVRYYCKNYSTFWGCTAAVGQGLKKSFKVSIKK